MDKSTFTSLHAGHPVGTTEPGGLPTRTQAKLTPDDYQGRNRQYPRISRPVELLRHTYDVVVIGSGYGGGVAASRMARAGQSVCLLERGKERWPGEYPTSISEAGPELSISGLFAPNDKSGTPIQIGRPDRLYHLVVGQGQNAFVASGLGGTSLLNANVFLQADQETMSLPSWPPELREPHCLEKYYTRAASMLQPAPYPEDFPKLPKLELLRKQAEALGQAHNFYRVPQTTRFESGPNSTGVQMQTSSLTGMDSTGVNDGSKSSTLVNYLADSWNWGAEIFCQCEVRCVKKHPTQDGYLVFFAWHGSKRGQFKNHIYHDLMWVHAKKFVFLGAGTLGTTEILLRSKRLGLQTSGMIGRGMSGNGDILAFGYNTDDEVGGMGTSSPHPNRPVGPTITGIIDCRKQANPLDGFVIEEGAVPEALVPVLQAMLEMLPGKIPPTSFGLVQQLRHFISRQQSRLYHYAPQGSLERTQTYLIMSHDSNQATMNLQEDKPVLNFLGVGRSGHVKYLNNLLAEATNSVGGTFVNNPFFAALGQQEITVHPIGGAILSSDGTCNKGVTNHVGEVFSGHDDQIHAGIVVVDGSMVPTALGVNPLATITALAERNVEAAATKAHLTIDFDTQNGLLDLYGLPAHLTPAPEDLHHVERKIRAATESGSEGIEFTELMSGYINLGDDVDDFSTAFEAGESAGQTARFLLSCHAWNIDELIGREDHHAMLTGTFTCAGLAGSPFMVLRGDFGLFTQDLRTPDSQNLIYDFDMVSIEGEVIHFHGYKVIAPSIALRPRLAWSATSTLFVTLTKLDKVLGRGVLQIQPHDLISELKTFSPSGITYSAKLFAAGKFLTYFTRQLLKSYLGPFGAQQWPTATYLGYKSAKRAPDETFKITASDQVISTMRRWIPPNASSPTRAGKIFLIPGASVDHQIFALPTIETNAVEFFSKQGFELFCITHRLGKTPNAQRGFTAYDARLDIRAAFQAIHEIQQSEEPIYVVAHCIGSIALASGLLDGTVPTRWIRGLTCSQVFTNPVFGTVNRLKTVLPIPMTTLYRFFAGPWFSCISTPRDTVVQRLLTQALRLYPVGSPRELCNSVVCHRGSLIFGRLWSHRQLNEATHANLEKFLGGITMPALQNLVNMGKDAQVADNKGASLVTPQNLDRLRGLQILFIHGSENVVYSPECTNVSYTQLTTAFGQDDYEREVIDGYGHLDCWMGSHAVEDVYPRVLRHIEKFYDGVSSTAE